MLSWKNKFISKEKIMKKCMLAVLVGLAFVSVAAVAQTFSFGKDSKYAEEFEKVVIVSAIIDQCEVSTISKAQKEHIQKFSKEYSDYLIEKSKYNQSTVTKIVAKSLFKIDEKYGDDIPVSVCESALTIIHNMEKQWLNNLALAKNKTNTLPKI